MTDYAPTVRGRRRKPPTGKCQQHGCVMLTRHRTRRCPDHRHGAGASSPGSTRWGR